MQKKVLIIGGNARLSKRFNSSLFSFTYTTRRELIDREGFIFLDLNDTSKFKIPCDIDSCIIVGGPTSYASPSDQNSNCRNIHNHEIPALVSRLLDQDIFVIYISSNMVFGARNKVRSEDSIPHPDIEYGKMKLICETRLQNLATESGKEKLLAVLRLTKHISPETLPFKNWIDSLKNQLPIYAFEDLYFSPIYYESTVNMLYIILAHSHSGIFHYSNKHNLNYYDFALEFKSFLKAKYNYDIDVIKTSSIEQGIKLEMTQAVTSLKMERTEKILRINPLGLDDIFNYLSNFIIDV